MDYVVHVAHLERSPYSPMAVGAGLDIGARRWRNWTPGGAIGAIEVPGAWVDYTGGAGVRWAGLGLVYAAFRECHTKAEEVPASDSTRPKHG